MQVPRRKGLKTWSPVFMAFACIVMYAMAATHLGLTIQAAYNSYARQEYLREDLAECLQEIVRGKPCAPSLSSDIEDSGLQALSRQCLNTALLVVNVSGNRRTKRY